MTSPIEARPARGPMRSCPTSTSTSAKNGAPSRRRPRGETRALWVALFVPESAVPGSYRGTGARLCRRRRAGDDSHRADGARVLAATHVVAAGDLRVRRARPSTGAPGLAAGRGARAGGNATYKGGGARHRVSLPRRQQMDRRRGSRAATHCRSMGALRRPRSGRSRRQSRSRRPRRGRALEGARAAPAAEARRRRAQTTPAPDRGPSARARLARPRLRLHLGRAVRRQLDEARRRGVERAAWSATCRGW